MADPKSNRKSPAFQFYPSDFLNDEHVKLMSLAECGAYIRLMCQCWIEGSLPAETTRLARLCGCPVQTFRKLWTAIAPCFRTKEPDRLIHPRLEKERQNQREYRRRQADNGAKRWDSHRSATALPAPNGRQASGNALISSLSQSHLNSHEHVRVRSLADEPKDLTERAGTFARETYPALYEKHRKGARYLSKPSVDFLEAVELCRVFDDERLSKIATVFLTTDHEFAEKGSRTMAQFRALASWCDGRLRERGL